MGIAHRPGAARVPPAQYRHPADVCCGHQQCWATTVPKRVQSSAFSLRERRLGQTLAQTARQLIVIQTVCWQEKYHVWPLGECTQRRTPTPC